MTKLSKEQEQMVKDLQEGSQASLQELLANREDPTSQQSRDIGRGIVAALLEVGVIQLPAKAKGK